MKVTVFIMASIFFSSCFGTKTKMPKTRKLTTTPVIAKKVVEKNVPQAPEKPEEIFKKVIDKLQSEPSIILK